MCPVLEKLKNKLQPYREVTLLTVEIRNSKKGKDVRILEHLLSYAKYKFGLYYCEREGGDRRSNWTVEIEILNEIITALADLYNQNNSLSILGRDNMALPYLERSLNILNPWVIIWIRTLVTESIVLVKTR
jgi:hypothetical protein